LILSVTGLAESVAHLMLQGLRDTLGGIARFALVCIEVALKPGAALILSVTGLAEVVAHLGAEWRHWPGGGRHERNCAK